MHRQALRRVTQRLHAGRLTEHRRDRLPVDINVQMHLYRRVESSHVPSPNWCAASGERSLAALPSPPARTQTTAPSRSCSDQARRLLGEAPARRVAGLSLPSPAPPHPSCRRGHATREPITLSPPP